MVVMIHDSDIPDPWEREGEDTQYFFRFSPDAYAVGINIVLYSMTQAKARPSKPIGEWNTLEITARGKMLTLWVNGAITCQFDNCGLEKGRLGLEGEGYRIEFRNLKLKELSAP